MSTPSLHEIIRYAREIEAHPAATQHERSLAGLVQVLGEHVARLNESLIATRLELRALERGMVVEADDAVDAVEAAS